MCHPARWRRTTGPGWTSWPGSCAWPRARSPAITGVTVTDADVRAAAEVYMQYMDKVQTLTDLVMNADCLPISGGELALFGLCVETCLCIDKSYVLDALDTIIAEVRERIDRGEGFGSRVAPRLAWPFQPPVRALARQGLPG